MLEASKERLTFLPLKTVFLCNFGLHGQLVLVGLNLKFRDCLNFRSLAENKDWQTGTKVLQ